jgi:hypothetical protein
MSLHLFTSTLKLYPAVGTVWRTQEVGAKQGCWTERRVTLGFVLDVWSAVSVAAIFNFRAATSSDLTLVVAQTALMSAIHPNFPVTQYCWMSNGRHEKYLAETTQMPWGTIKRQDESSQRRHNHQMSSSICWNGSLGDTQCSLQVKGHRALQWRVRYLSVFDHSAKEKKSWTQVIHKPVEIHS